MKCLVTGGAGFIGSHLGEELLRQGNEVWVIDDLSTGSRDNIAHLLENKNFHFFRNSILEQGVLRELISKSEVIYHLAAAVGVKYIMENLLHSLRINIDGCKNVLEIASEEAGKKVLLTSSSEIYGKNEDAPFAEGADRILGSPHKIRWSYSCSKALDEFLGLAYFEERRLPVVIVRLFNVCGPRQTGRYGMVIPRFVTQALRNDPITVYGDGKQVRTFIHVKDAIPGLISLMESDKANGEIFNLGSSHSISIAELALKIKELTQSKSEIKFLSYEEVFGKDFEDLKVRIPDTSRISKTIKFSPKLDLDDILKEVIEYYRKVDGR